MKRKFLDILIVVLVILSVGIIASTLLKNTKILSTDITEGIGEKNTITATFRYLDDKDQEINGDEVLYLFLTSKNGTRMKTKMLKANETATLIEYMYDQNGQNKDFMEDLEFQLIVAKDKQDREVEVSDTTKFDENNFDIIKNGDIYNGSYRVTIKSDIDMRHQTEGHIDVVVKSLQGRKYTTDEILPQLDLAYGFGVFARDYWQTADIEATIAVETAHDIGSDFGLSPNNYEAFYKSDESHKIVVDKVYIQDNNEPTRGAEVEIELYEKGTPKKLVEVKTCITDSDGRCSVTFKDVKAGSYSIAEKVNGTVVETDQVVKDEDGNDITITMPENNDVTISKQIVNYNYIEKISSDSNITGSNISMRAPGTLVVATEALRNQWKEDAPEKFNGDVNPEGIKLLVVGEEESKKIDFDSEFSKLNKVSVKLANAIDSSDIKVYYLNDEQIAKPDLYFTSDGRDYIVINVDCTNFNGKILDVGGRHYRDGNLMQGEKYMFEDGSKTIINFFTKDGAGNIEPFTGEITINGGTAGIFLAPSARVNGANGNHEGTMIAKEYNHTTGEVHQQIRGMIGTLALSNSIVTNNDEPKIKVSKIDASSKPVSGAKMQLLNSAGKILEEWTTDGNIYVIKTILTPGKKYIIREAYAPEGYQPSKDYEFVAPKTGDNDLEIKIIDTQLLTSKLDEAGNYLEGATLQIVDEKGYVLEEWVSTNEVHTVQANLNPGQKYFLREKKAPDGYKKSKDVEFTLIAGKDNQEIQMKNEKIVLDVSVNKTDWNQEVLPGAILQIIDSDGIVLDEWTSDGLEHRITPGLLKAGEKYILHEVSAPEGYEVSEDLEFILNSTENKQVVSMIDNKIRLEGEPLVKVTKLNEDNNIIDGAVLQIIDSEGNVLEEWTSNGYPHIIEVNLQKGQTYTLHEKLAPTGYKKSKDVTFIVEDTDEEQEVTMIDNRIKKVAGAVETLDNSILYVGIFITSLTLFIIGLQVYKKLNKKV